MRERKYYYLVECENGINRTETIEYAKNHWEAEKQAQDVYFKKYQAYPVEVTSRKSSKAEAEALF